MTINRTKVLLQELFEKNQREAAKTALLKQRCFPATMTGSERIPTLEASVLQPMTEMLRERFSFAGTWVNAAYGHTWLDINGIAAAQCSKEIIEHLEVRRRYFDGHLLQVERWDRLTLFGVDLEEKEETLLHWGDGEPAVATYVGYGVERYENLAVFLDSLVND